MISQTIMLAFLLGTAPASPPSDVTRLEFIDRIESVDVTASDNDAQIIAFDDAGEVIGSLAIWIDDHGVTWLASDYDDGYMLVSVDPATGDVTREGDLAELVAAERVEVMVAFLDDQKPTLPKREKEKPKHTWTKCFIAAGGAVWGCYKINPWKCVGGAAACACLPKTVKEFEGYKCPGV